MIAEAERRPHRRRALGDQQLLRLPLSSRFPASVDSSASEYSTESGGSGQICSTSIAAGTLPIALLVTSANGSQQRRDCSAAAR